MFEKVISHKKTLALSKVNFTVSKALEVGCAPVKALYIHTVQHDTVSSGWSNTIAGV